MIRQISDWITVLDVIRDMEVEPTDKLVVKVGNLMQKWFASELCGAQPEKDLHRKKNGGGSHCMAYYPEMLRAKIEAFVKMCQMEAVRQPNLFDQKERPGVEVDLIFPS